MQPILKKCGWQKSYLAVLNTSRRAKNSSVKILLCNVCVFALKPVVVIARYDILFKFRNTIQFVPAQWYNIVYFTFILNFKYTLVIN